MSTSKTRFAASAALLAAWLAGGCGGDGGSEPDPNEIASVSVSPSSASVDVGSTTALQATARNAAGDAVSTSFNWTSSQAGNASVSGAGVVTGVAAGSATISASAGGRSGSATVTVTDPFPPAAPSAVQATPVSDAEVQVTWTDNANNETEFRIEREAVGAGVGSLVSAQVIIAPAFSHAGSTGPNVTTFLDGGLSASTAYRYHVLGCNANGCSQPSAQSSDVSTFDHPTLVLQKIVQSAAGGSPDNPSNPSLAGFEFQVRIPGTSTVVAAMTTDTSGMASATVPGGMYDVRETNSKGLEDVTQAVNGRNVVAGQDNTIDWTNRQAAVPQGTIVIQKQIESATGGAPDNPASPPLSGFVFEIRAAGQSAVLTTMTTGADGQSSVMLPIGAYDVVESNSQGLTDLSLAANGVTVAANAESMVTWINRQDPPPMGTITIQKTIESSTGGAPDNPPNPSLAGFDFDVRLAGTTTVIASGTTNTAGQVQLSLAPGTYDLVETDPQGLTDVTVLAAGIVVTDGGNSPVPWTNRQALLVTGMLTIMKFVQGKDGGAPVPPFTVQGYVFDIRQAGTATVVTQVVTDATGKAVATLPAGAYDVVEDDAQLLIDITGPSGNGNGIMVTAGQDTPLNWTNRQQHLVGMLRFPNPRFIARQTDPPFQALLFTSLQGSVPPLFAGAMGNGNVLTIDFIPAGPDNVLVAERNPVDGSIIRTFTEDIRTMGPDPCYHLACLATLQTPLITKEVWRLDPFTSTWSLVAPGRDAAVFDGPNGETRIWFDDVTGTMMKHEPGVAPGAGNSSAPAVGAVPVSGLSTEFDYYEPSVCPGNGTLLLRRTPVAAQQFSDIVAYDLNIQAATVSNQRVLTTDGGSSFPVCLDDTGALPVFFFQKVIMSQGAIWKHDANGMQTSLNDPAEFRPFRWR